MCATGTLEGQCGKEIGDGSEFSARALLKCVLLESGMMAQGCLEVQSIDSGRFPKRTPEHRDQDRGDPVSHIPPGKSRTSRRPMAMTYPKHR